MASPTPTPNMENVPGAFPASVSSRAASQLSTRSEATIRPDERPITPSPAVHEIESHETPRAIVNAPLVGNHIQPVTLQPDSSVSEQNNTAPIVAPIVAPVFPDEKNNSNTSSNNTTTTHPTEEVDTSYEKSSFHPEDAYLAPIVAQKTQASTKPNKDLQRTKSTEDDVFRTLSRRRTSYGPNASRVQTQHSDDPEEQAEIERLLSRMFGKSRQQASDEEKTRHVGVVWKNLTVKGLGLGAALQPSTSDVFLGIPRAIASLFAGKSKSVKSVKVIIDDFNGCIKPGEMCLVLGRPGSGCSTFLKVLGNQRFGYESVEGSVTYGGTDAKTMAKKYRGEVLYNPEDDFHYATLK